MTSMHTVSDCPIFGNSSDLSEKVLPTYSEEMKCYMQEKQIMKLCSNKDPSMREILELVVKKIKYV